MVISDGDGVRVSSSSTIPTHSLQVLTFTTNIHLAINRRLIIRSQALSASSQLPDQRVPDKVRVAFS